MSSAVRNIGILAHIDAGKTTLTERMLLLSGAIRECGNVDRGTAHTDYLDIERRRGISVRAASVQLSWNDILINLIDTPGHADFSSEVERSIWALDGVVLLLNAVEGVQPQVEALFDVLRRQKIPTLLFVNKTDREGADTEAAVRQAKKQLSERVALWENDEALMELLCDFDEAALADFVSGQIYPRAELVNRLKPLVASAQAYPALAGSALSGAGVEELLSAMVELLPAPQGEADAPLSGIVFATEEDKLMGRAAHVRMYSGTLVNRATVSVSSAQGEWAQEAVAQELKVTQIRRIRLDGRGEDVGQLRAGEIAAVYGLGDVRSGQILGDANLLPGHVKPGIYRAPLLMARVLPESEDQLPALRHALDVMSAEDPQLDVMWSSTLRQLHIRIMGLIQLEVLEEQLRTRFQLNARFEPPSVIYRETIAQAAEGFVAYTMPKPCWAVMKFLIEPAERGSGITFDSVVPVRKIDRRYQNQVRQALPLALRQGRMGWQVDDVKITLIDGGHHLIHTHPLDFIVATPMGIHDGLQRGGSTLLEPMLNVKIAAPASCAGRLMSDVVSMRGNTISSEINEDRIYLNCELPVATSQNYPSELAALSGGRASLSMQLCGYREVEEGPSCPLRSVDPLDTAKYILAARSALEGGIFG